VPIDAAPGQHFTRCALRMSVVQGLQQDRAAARELHNAAGPAAADVAHVRLRHLRRRVHGWLVAPPRPPGCVPVPARAWSTLRALDAHLQRVVRVRQAPRAGSVPTFSLVAASAAAMTNKDTINETLYSMPPVPCLPTNQPRRQ